MTLNGVLASFLSNSVDLGANYVNVVEDRAILSATKMSKESSFQRHGIGLMAIFADVTENERINNRHAPL